MDVLAQGLSPSVVSHAECQVTKQYTLHFAGGGGGGCQICGGQSFACSDNSGNAMQSFQDTNSFSDEFVSLTATMQYACAGPSRLNLLINNDYEGYFPEPDSCDPTQTCGASADACTVYTFTNTDKGNYALGNQNEISFSGGDGEGRPICFTYLELEITVNSTTCEPDNTTMIQPPPPAPIALLPPPTPLTIASPPPPSPSTGKLI